MTSRGLYEALLTELVKVNAPSMLLSDFNYYSNKTVQAYINKRYNLCEINQQLTDDLRVIKSTADITKIKQIDDYYEIIFPNDYLHLLNCFCVYEIQDNNNNCDKQGSLIQYPAKRLTADSLPLILTNYYNRPTFKRPYYFINNVNSKSTNPTNPGVTDIKDIYKVKNNKVVNSNFPRTIKLNFGKEVSTVNKETGVRYGNLSNVRCEIRCGDDSKYKLVKVIIHYLKTPQTINLTQEQLDIIKDTSQILEWPEYVCYEIINELVNFVQESVSDPRLQTHFQVTQSIANPVQQQNK